MPYSTPPTAVNGTAIASAHVNTLRDNDNWFNGLLGSPAFAGQVPISTSTSAASYGFLGAASITDAAVTAAKLMADGVDTAQLGAGSVTTAKLASAAAALLVPAGICGWVRKASEIPASWARETNLDGRMIVGAGTTFSTTFTEATNYGAAWSHIHTQGTVAIGDVFASGADIDGVTPQETAASHPSHGHNSFASGTFGTTTWVIPSRGYVAVRR